jgi:hypothetical protein
MRAGCLGLAGAIALGAAMLLHEPIAAQLPPMPDGGQGPQGVVGGLLQARGGEAMRPAPRNAAGRVLLGGGTPQEKGVWVPGPVVAEPLRPAAEIPFQSWAREMYAYRRTHELEPHARCKASGVSRQFLTPYGVEIVELPELQRIYIFDIGGPQTYRTIYMDGRSHPLQLEPSRSYYGHSIGWWEGDTLIVETVGFNESFWMDRDGLPHTEALRTVERLTRVDATSMRYELLVDDPGAYTATWQGGMNLRWEAGTELFEFVCQQANYAHELMVGVYESVDRSAPIVP